MIDGEGRIVVGESGFPQVTNDDGGSCCCGCPEPFPSLYQDAFSGLDQQGDLFFTPQTHQESPRAGAYPVGEPYSLEQLALSEGRFQLIAFDENEPSVNGTLNRLMNNGFANFYYPPRWLFSNVPDYKNPKIVAPSQFQSAVHKSITTEATIHFGTDMTSHQEPMTNPDTGEEEQMASGYPFILGLLAMQTLNPFYSVSGSGQWRREQFQVGVYIWEPASLTFNVEDWPYVEWEENHLKRVDFDTFDNGVQSKTLYLPIESGDTITIAAEFISYKQKQKFGREVGEWSFCVSFLIEGVEVHRKRHVVYNSIEGNGVEFPPSQMFCEYLTNPYVQTYSERALTKGTFPDWKQYRLSNLSPMVTGFDNLSVVNSEDSLGFNCDAPEPPDPVVMQSFADSTGRTLDPPSGETPTPPPAAVELTYPYNWANMSTLSPVNFPAVITGTTASPLSFTIASGSLPASGLYLDSATGTVQGTPVSSQSGTVSLQLTDANGTVAISPVYTWNVTGGGGGGVGAGGP